MYFFICDIMLCNAYCTRDLVTPEVFEDGSSQEDQEEEDSSSLNPQDQQDGTSEFGRDKKAEPEAGYPIFCM